MRYYVRTGRRSGVSMPFSVALIGYALWAALVWTLAFIAALSVVVVAAAYMLGLGLEAAWLRRRDSIVWRSALRPPELTIDRCRELG